MSRTERLLDLLQILRRHRSPITGPDLAAELGVSLRTLYRDPTHLDFGFTFVVADPDGHRLRPFVLADDPR